MLEQIRNDCLILNHQTAGGVIAFQSDVTPTDAEARYYLEILAAQSKKPNRQYYWFTDDALKMLVADYEKGLSVMVNHNSFGSVGLGETVSAEFKENSLYLVGYLLRGYTDKTWDADKIILAVEDGFLKDASLGLKVTRSRCSICDKDYDNWSECRHIRGFDDIVEDANGNKRVETCYVMIEECEGVEVSLTYDGSDKLAGVTRKGISLSGGFEWTEEEKAFLANQHSQLQPNNNGGSGMSAELQAQLAAVTAELTTAKAQLAAKESEVTAQAATLTLRDERITALETEVAGFKTKETENAVLIADGKAAREEAVKEYCEARVKFHGADYKPEMRETDERFAKAYPLHEIRFHTDQTLERAKERYPEGAEVNTGDPDDADAPRQIIVPNVY